MGIHSSSRAFFPVHISWCSWCIVQHVGQIIIFRMETQVGQVFHDLFWGLVCFVCHHFFLRLLNIPANSLLFSAANSKNQKCLNKMRCHTNVRYKKDGSKALDTLYENVIMLDQKKHEFRIATNLQIKVKNDHGTNRNPLFAHTRIGLFRITFSLIPHDCRPELRNA